MPEKRPDPRNAASNTGFEVLRDRQDWDSLVNAVAARFNRDYQGIKPELPEEVKAMPIYQDRYLVCYRPN